MINKKIPITLSFLLITAILLTSNVSASDFTRLLILDNLLKRSADYDIIYEAPYNNGRVIASFRGGRDTGLSGLNLVGNFNRLEYERIDNRFYDSSLSNYNYRNLGRPWNYRGSYSRFGNPGYYSYSYPSYGNNVYSRNNYERLYIDNYPRYWGY